MRIRRRVHARCLMDRGYDERTKDLDGIFEGQKLHGKLAHCTTGYEFLVQAYDNRQQSLSN